MSDLTLAVRLTADGSQLVGQLSASELEAKGLGATLADVGTKAKAASTGTDALGTSSATAGAKAKEAAAGAGALASATGTLEASARGATAGAGELGTSANRLGVEAAAAAAGALKAATGAQSMAAGSRTAANDTVQLAAAASSLRSALDPMYAAQVRFDQELTTADRLLEANVITQREHAAAVKLSRDALQLHANTVGGDGSQLRKHQQVLNSSTVSLGAQRAGYQQLGAQVQDSFVQFNAGTSILQILSQQGPQVAAAISLAGTAADGTGSKVAKLATFLSGPLGAAVFGVTTLLGFFIQHLVQSGDESEKSKDKSLSLADALTKEKSATEEGQKALKDFIKTKKDGQAQDSLSTQATLAAARASIQSAIAKREELKAELELQQASFERIARSAANDVVVQGALRDAGVARTKLAAQDALIGTLEGAKVALVIDDAADAAKAAVDPIAAINRQFDNQRDTANRTARAVGKLTEEQERQYRSNIAGIEKRRAAALDEERDRQAAERRANRPRTDRSDLSADTGARLLSTAQSFTGLNENRAGDRSTLKGLFGEANLNIDPAMTAWCAAFVNAVLGKEKLPTNGSLAARSFLNYGQAVDRPEKGDIVVLKRGGNEAQGHVGFYAGEGSNGTIRVTGGNQSNQVSTASFKRSDVLAYRRAPTASQAEAAAEKAAREVDRLQGVGDRARDAIGGTLAGFSDAPSQVTKTVQALVKLDGVIADLSREKPPGFADLVASAEAAKVQIAGELGPAIADAVRPFEDAAPDLLKAAAATKQLDGALKTIADNRPQLEKLLGVDGVAALEEQARAAGDTVRQSLGQPFRDLIRDQTEGLAVQRLQNEGREVEAQQLAFLQDLQRQYNVASAEALAIELAKRGTTADELEQKLQLFEQERALAVEAAKRRDIERQHLGEVDRLRGNIERTIEDLPQRGLKVLGDFGRELTGQLQNYLARYLTETLFGGAFQQLERQLTGQDQVASANRAYVGQVGHVVDALRNLEAAADAASDAQTQAAGGVVITAPGGPEDGRPAPDPFDFRLKSPRELFSEIAKGLLTNVLGDELAGKIGDKVGAALQGAATGSTAASIVFGKKADSTGSAIGGGIGQIAGEEFLGFLGKAAGPVGAIAGGLLGSLLGNAFTKPKFGAASLTSATGDIAATGRGAASIEAAKGAAGSVQDGLKRIAEAFDAQLGSFAVTIGTYKDKYRVNTTGSSTVGGSKKPVAGLKDFGDDEAGAIAYAITDAIADGAVQGVSAAVQQALRSSKDLETAIVEALKVQDLEELLGGIQGEIDREFRVFERQAKERLRIATDYGFDLVAVEKRNAEDRVKLVDQVLSDRAGPLKDLLDDLTGGNLFEGAAAEKRQALRSQIADAEAKATAGEDGAVKRLADLNRQLVELSRDAFGTAGAEYGADRADAVASAERVIQIENDRVRAAQAASERTNDELARGNALANEGNDLAAQQLAELRRIGGLPLASAGRGGAGVSTSRSVQL